MALVEHSFDSPDRFVAGTVGAPGERTFFLQARQGNRLTSVACEKQQVSVLAEHLDRVLSEIGRLTQGAVTVPDKPEAASDNDPLDAPIDEEFRVGTMTIAWDPAQDLIVIEMFAAGEEGDPAADLDDPSAEEISAAEAERSGEVMIVRLDPAAAREFVARAEALVASGRPACPFCLQPVDAGGHICPRANGYRRALF